MELAEGSLLLQPYCVYRLHPLAARHGPPNCPHNGAQPRGADGLDVTQRTQRTVGEFAPDISAGANAPHCVLCRLNAHGAFGLNHDMFGRSTALPLLRFDAAALRLARSSP